jgi:predicted DNA-binding transcriptional regulator YafY
MNESFFLREETQYVQLFENYDQNLRNIEFAIQNKMVCSMNYRGEPGTRVVPGTRYIEPYALGVDSNGNTLLRAWLIRGVSRSGRINPRLVPGWRMFRVDRINMFNPTLQKFTVARKGYNPDDKNMEEVTFSAKF